MHLAWIYAKLSYIENTQQNQQNDLSIQQRLGRSPGWSESSLGARHFVGFVMLWLIYCEGIQISYNAQLTWKHLPFKISHLKLVLRVMERNSFVWAFFPYRKFPKFSDTPKIVVITLKVEQMALL